MVITSKNNERPASRYHSAQLRYALVYVIITFIVLLFLNIYTSRSSQELFYTNKETAMIERCRLAASDISALQIINEDSVSAVADQLKAVPYTRLVVTDAACKVIYDSAATGKTWLLFPEILHALEKQDVFTWNYSDGIMRSCAAVPFYSYGELAGCVYMTEFDSEQGMLIRSLQTNVLSVTLTLEILVIVFSFFFTRRYANRVRRLRNSMRIIRGGDYSHQVKMGGRDELTLLGTEFNDLTERLKISEDKRRQFVSDASHELKTPLASIKLLSDSILQNPMDSETIREFVGDIGAEAERLNRLSEKLLALSRADSATDSECEIIYMAPTVQRVAKMLSSIAAQNNITIETDLLRDSTILISQDDLYQIIFNLAENGIKYNHANGVLRISLSREEDNAVVEFADTGMGIPEDAQGNIFERFYRVDKARSRKTGGSGLGLSIVRELVLRHSGNICVTSKPDTGSVFRVTFPVFDVEEAAQ